MNRERCTVCDRADCPTLTGPTYASISDDWTTAMIHANAWSNKVAECRARAVAWRTRCLAAEATVEAMRPVVEATLAERAAWDERERMEGQGFRSSSRDNAVAAAANALDAAIDTYRAPPHGKDGGG